MPSAEPSETSPRPSIRAATSRCPGELTGRYSVMPSTAPSMRAFHMGSPPGRDPTASSATRPRSSLEIAALRAALESGLDVPAPLPPDIARSGVNPADGGLVATTDRSRILGERKRIRHVHATRRLLLFDSRGQAGPRISRPGEGRTAYQIGRAHV